MIVRIRNKRKENITVHQVKEGKVVNVFKSVRSAAKYAMVSPLTMSVIIRTHRVYDGCEWTLEGRNYGKTK